MISIQDIIFNKDKVQNGIPFQYTINKSKELDEAIQVIELLQIDKLEDIQLSENLEVKSEIIHQTDHKIEDLDTNNIIAKINT